MLLYQQGDFLTFCQKPFSIKTWYISTVLASEPQRVVLIATSTLYINPSG